MDLRILKRRTGVDEKIREIVLSSTRVKDIRVAIYAPHKTFMDTWSKHRPFKRFFLFYFHSMTSESGAILDSWTHLPDILSNSLQALILAFLFFSFSLSTQMRRAFLSIPSVNPFPIHRQNGKGNTHCQTERLVSSLVPSSFPSNSFSVLSVLFFLSVWSLWWWWSSLHLSFAPLSVIRLPNQTIRLHFPPLPLLERIHFSLSPSSN